ncbi:hypothetical protein FHU38_003640 [Saccharomonospora amisosensis]|uniref:Uncharacterized protein n=1 Tax=Saccharomonospora amisosensis TaxID=1128677 RepID=A0A7X5USA0_9PSEU|nr:alpha/beta hydrolase-fold protein [Saccharomonospora amisosensis]NIJ13296.1 hypothetical protein [Saccharomonospora amisosensis]
MPSWFDNELAGWCVSAADTDEPKRYRIGRRGLLLGALGGIAAGAASFNAGSQSLDWALRRSITLSSPLSGTGFTRLERVYSRARGRWVELALTLPTRNPPAGMPISLLLHGRHGSARTAAPEGLAQCLAGAVARGRVPPFGFLAVDGGDSYWHEHRPGDDPMGMLLLEVPNWLKELRLSGEGGIPFACAGISMGGFGSLLYARHRAQRRSRLRAVGAISPALLTSWQQMRKRRAFNGPLDWASMDPLRHIQDIGDVPIGVWCGTQDPFISGTRRFISATNPEVAFIAEGKHNGEFFSRVAPGLVAFLGRHAPKPVRQGS